MCTRATDGEWRNDLRHGQGTATWVSGLCYEGGWHKDKTNGDGKAVYPNGDKARASCNIEFARHS